MRIQYNLDVLKPHQPTNDKFALTLKKVKGTKYINIKIDEIDQNTTSVFIKIVGTEELSLENIRESLDSLSSSIHSCDEVIIEDYDWD